MLMMMKVLAMSTVFQAANLLKCTAAAGHPVILLAGHPRLSTMMAAKLFSNLFV
jgi:hypothetical protein